MRFLRYFPCFLVLLVTANVLVGCGGGRRAGAPAPAEDAGVAEDSATTDTIPEPLVEECNQYDDDMDGAVDESCSCTLGETQGCYPASREVADGERCTNGTQICVSIAEFPGWTPCESFVRCEAGEDAFVYGETRSARPVDIVWAVDQSGSMSEEIANVRANINRFAAAVAGSGIDYRVILMASKGSSSYDICVSEPLAGPACADSMTFHQVDQNVQSTNALSLFQSNITEIESFMREGSLRVFIVVTDDNSSVTASAFDSFLLSRPGYDDYLFDGVIGTASCPGTARVGTEYQELAALRGGATTDICDADWGASFERFAREIIDRTVTYPLLQVPYEGTVQVFFVDALSAEVEQPEGTAWSYDAEMNAVTINDGFTPENGTDVIVRYRVAF